MTTVEISGQRGEPSSRKSVWPLHKKMSDALSACVVGKYFKSISKIAIVFRVSGKIRSFSPEAPGMKENTGEEYGGILDVLDPNTGARSIRVVVPKS